MNKPAAKLALIAATALLAGCPPLVPLGPTPALTVDRAKEICPTVFAVAEIPAGQTCEAVARPLGLQALKRYAPGPDVLKQLSTRGAQPLEPLDPLTAAGQFGIGQPERRIGRQTFCVLAPGPGPVGTPDDFRAALRKVAGPGNQRAVPDCGVMRSSQAMGAPQLEPLTLTTQRQTRGYAGDAAGNPGTPALPWSQLPGLGKGVRVAIVDGSPFDITRPDTSGHGFSVGQAVASVGCARPTDPDCIARLPGYLALPMGWIKGQPRFIPGGGYFGHLHQLADAIERAVDDWVDGGQRDKLVVNLSLGWDPHQTRDRDPDVAMVVQQLRRASCGGALIVAAAGNATGTSGPLAPGAYETVPAPADCSEFAGGKMVLHPALAGTPLVYAVAGLDPVDAYLDSTRPNGKPERAAYGLFATMAVHSATVNYAGPLSGSSAAAAFVSGVAAAAWSHAPALSTLKLMEALYDGGAALGSAPADFCLSGTCRPAHRISLCGALRALPPSASTACATVPFATALTANLSPRDPGMSVTTQALSTAPPLPPASSPYPWVAPQDPEHPCITCAYSKGFDTVWGITKPGVLRSVTAESFDATGGAAPWNPFWIAGAMGGYFQMSHLNLGAWNASMRIHWVLQGSISDYSTTDDVLVTP
jgi:hypothetical protein